MHRKPLRSFQEKLFEGGLTLTPLGIDTLQVNVTKLCNQACTHCHVDASPTRTEQMDKRTVDRCLEVLSLHENIRTLDITGGAPELNPHFDHLVIHARKLGKRVIVRHNLTVTLDGNPQTNESKEYLPRFFSQHQAEVVSSLPCYQEPRTNKQRGHGVFTKSIESLKLLNQQGYGQAGSGLILNLVHNPVGTHLPPDQNKLEQDYKNTLLREHGIVFNRLLTMTNMPVHRFKKQLEFLGSYDDYMDKLKQSFNATAALGIMCRNLISVAHDGTLYDCDFNQMLELSLDRNAPQTIFDFDFEKIARRKISFDSHCFGCTAGSGSSCGGATVSLS